MDTGDSEDSSNMKVDKHVTVTSKSDNHNLDDILSDSMSTYTCDNDMKKNQLDDSFINGEGTPSVLLSATWSPMNYPASSYQSSNSVMLCLFSFSSQSTSIDDD